MSRFLPALIAVEAMPHSEKALELVVPRSAAEPSSVTVAQPLSKFVEAAVGLILSFDYEASTTAGPIQISD